MSDSGDHVYFTAFGNLATGATSFGSNLYLWTPSGTRFVAALNPTEFYGPTNWSLSPNSRFFAFESIAPLTGGGNRSSACGATADAPCKQVFIYDSDTRRVRCVSCDPAGGPAISTLGSAMSPQAGRAVTDDGRVFFNSDARLVAGDTNGKTDVYEWDGSAPQLITTGTSSSSSFGRRYLGGREHGVLLYRGVVVGQDVDTNVDLYAARADGGLAEQNTASVGGRRF